MLNVTCVLNLEGNLCVIDLNMERSKILIKPSVCIRITTSLLVRTLSVILKGN